MQSNNSFLDLIILLIISCFSSILPFFVFHFSLIFSTCLSPTHPIHLLSMSIHHPSPSENNCQATMTWKIENEKLNIWNELALLWAPMRSFRTFVATLCWHLRFCLSTYLLELIAFILRNSWHWQLPVTNRQPFLYRIFIHTPSWWNTEM